MFSTDDTIVAIATPPGRGGIGVVRLSGPRSLQIAGRFLSHPQPLVPRYATLATVGQSASPDVTSPAPAIAIDEAVVTWFKAPHSYTGDDVVEVSAHGSPVVLQYIVKAAVAAGARPAEPGEFTLRAFLNGRIDLPQAEAVADLIESVTPLQARAAFDQLQGTLTRVIADVDERLFDLVARLEASVDFPDEGYHFIQPDEIAGALHDVQRRLAHLLERGKRGRILREGRTVAIIGAPNVGKSSVFNALVGAARAIVTEVAGTTRDLISETVDLDGLRVTLVDTAGLRATEDVVEREGVARSHQAAAAADLVIEVIDGAGPDVSSAASGEQVSRLREGATVVRVSNKSDLPGFVAAPDSIAMSALDGSGLDDLRAAISGGIGTKDYGDCPEITNTRHLSLVAEAHASIAETLGNISGLADRVSEEFILADLQTARRCLEEVTGKRSSDDLLARIFERFCVGK